MVEGSKVALLKCDPGVVGLDWAARGLGGKVLCEEWLAATTLGEEE